MKKYFIFAFILKFLILVYPGWVVADTTLNGRWLDYFEEGDSVRVDRGVAVTTRVAGAKAGAYLKTGLWTWNLERSSLSFRVKVSEWKETSVLTLVVGNGLKFNNAATIDIRQRLVGAADNEWIELVVPPSAWTVEGTVDWKNIDSVLFVAADAGTEKRVKAQIANIKVVPIIEQNVQIAPISEVLSSK